MRSTVKPSAPTNETGQSPNWEELTRKAPEPTQLDNIKAQLDLVLLALEALAEIGSEAMLKVAAELNLEPMVADRVALWRLRQSNPLRKGQRRAQKTRCGGSSIARFDKLSFGKTAPSFNPPRCCFARTNGRAKPRTSHNRFAGRLY